MKKGICFTAYAIGFVDENGEFLVANYIGKEKIANVAIDIIASDTYKSDLIRDRWFVEPTIGKLKDALDNWEYETRMEVKRIQEGK